MPEDCENDASWKSHGTATRESWWLLIMQNACSHWFFFPTKAWVLSTMTSPASKNPFHITSASTFWVFSSQVSFHQTLSMFPIMKSDPLQIPSGKYEGSIVSSCLSRVAVVLPFQLPSWRLRPCWLLFQHHSGSPYMCHRLHGSTQLHPDQIRKAGTETWWADAYNHLSLLF